MLPSGRPRTEEAKPASIAARERSIRKDRVTAEQWDLYLQKRRAYMQNYREANRDRWRKQERESRKRYRDRKLAEVAGRPKPHNCEVCGNDSLPVVFDHCHVSEKFRGWICSNCNAILGLSGDNPERLRKLADYLSLNL